MSGKSLQSVATLVETDNLPEAPIPGDIELTFSAPFYTGVFLSSRELQGDYEYYGETSEGNIPCANSDMDRGEDYVCHQKIAINEMEKRLPLRWSLPPDVSNFWDRAVSPSYFIGCSLTEESDIMNRLSKIEEILFNIEKVDFFDFKIKTIDVKFYEFGFGSVSISFSKLKFSIGALNVAEIHEKLLVYSRKLVKNIFLNPIAKKATEAYCSSVPCCIKNSDIWDIDNFAGLEASEPMCRIGKVQEISIVATLKEDQQVNYNRIKNNLESNFLCFSEDLHKVPYNATYRLFTDGESITIALGRQKNEKEIDGILFVIEMIGVNLAVGRYFNSFFYSYFNYTASEYETIMSMRVLKTRNIKRLENLIEKFFDCKTMYSQIRFQNQENSCFNSNNYRSKFLNLHPKYEKVKEIWNKADELVAKVTDMNNQMNAIGSQYSSLANLSTRTASAILQVIGIFVVLALEYTTDLDIFEDSLLFVFIVYFSLYSISVLLLVAISWKSRKLHYISNSQKQGYQNMSRVKKIKNKNKNNFICELKKCHRCQNSMWHHSVFYRN